MTSALWRLTRFNVSFAESACLDGMLKKRRVKSAGAWMTLIWWR